MGVVAVTLARVEEGLALAESGAGGAEPEKKAVLLLLTEEGGGSANEGREVDVLKVSDDVGVDVLPLRILDAIEYVGGAVMKAEKVTGVAEGLRSGECIHHPRAVRGGAKGGAEEGEVEGGGNSMLVAEGRGATEADVASLAAGFVADEGRGVPLAWTGAAEDVPVGEGSVEGGGFAEGVRDELAMLEGGVGTVVDNVLVSKHRLEVGLVGEAAGARVLEDKVYLQLALTSPRHVCDPKRSGKRKSNIILEYRV